VLAWLSVWSEMQTCIWPSWCHCHSLSLAPVESRLVLPLSYRLTWVVPDKGPLNGCVCAQYTKKLIRPDGTNGQADVGRPTVSLTPRWAYCAISVNQLYVALVPQTAFLFAKSTASPELLPFEQKLILKHEYYDVTNVAVHMCIMLRNFLSCICVILSLLL